MTRAAALAALAWWRDAGVDVLVEDAPRDWLAISSLAGGGGPRSGEDAVERAPLAAAFIAPPPPAPSIPLPQGTSETDLSALADTLARADTLDALRLAVEAIRPRAIFADGDPASGVMIVGETAAPDDERTGKPFSGPAGALLDRMLAAIGRDRASTYISNLLLWRGFGGKPSPADVAIGAAILRRHIELARPKALLVMSGVAANALFDTSDGITRLRGKWIDLTAGAHNVAALPTFNPAYLLRRPVDKRLAWADLLMFKAKIDA